MSAANPDLSVIVPVYNKAKYLAACLDSVLDQGDVTVEVVCVDDASTDDSVAVIAGYVSGDSAVRLMQNESRRGAGYSRNRGLHAARGAYVQFTDADDILPSGALHALHAAIQSSRADVARGMPETLRRGEVSPWPAARIASGRIGTLLQLPELWIPWFHWCYLISRQLLLERDIGYPDLIVGEDPVFMARVLTAASRIVTVPTVTYLYRQDEPRPQQTLKTVEDYLRHAQIVKTIYGGEFLPCWNRYEAHVREDLRLLLSQAAVEPREYARLDDLINNL